MAFNYRDFIHPDDESARKKLESIVGFDSITKWMMNLGVERYCHFVYMSDSIRLSRNQLPEIYELLPPVCEKFGINEPEFYLQMHPSPNAETYGDKQTFLVITSGLLEHVTDKKELQSILAHECGHIICRHVFYRTMAQLLFSFGNMLPIPGVVLSHIQKPFALAMNYWSRKSELSADRASAIYCGGPEVPAKALLRLTGGPSKFTRAINLGEFARQAEACDEFENDGKWQKALGAYAVMDRDHPFSSSRIRELMSWGNNETCRRLTEALDRGLIGLSCQKCGNAIEQGQKFCRYCGHKIV